MKRLIFAGFILSLLAITALSTNLPGQGARSPRGELIPASSAAAVNISNSATDSDWPCLGVDQNGAAYLIWFEYQASRSFYFATNKSGLWSTPLYVDQIVYNAGEAGYPWMAVSASGVCHMTFQDGRTWVSYDIFHAAYENNSWTSLTNVSDNNGGSCYSGCAVNPIDNSLSVVWQDGTGLDWGWNLLLRHRSSSGSWSSTQIFPHSGGYMPKMAIDGAGTAHLIWTTGWGRTLWYSKNATPQNAAGWSSPTQIKGDVGEDWSYPVVVCDNAGNAYIIWMDGTVGNDEIFLRRVNSNGTLGPEINVSQSAASSQEGTLAVDVTNGNILIAWRENNDIFANAFIGGLWTGPGNVTQGAAPSKMPSVAVDRAGGAHLAFAANVGGNWEILYMCLRSGILVTSPNGGEIWEAGSSHNITWISTGISGNVKIEHSVDNGANYSTVVASTPNSGLYNWTVPNVSSTQCLVKISEATSGSPSDSSNAPFTIKLSSVNGYYVLDGYGGIHAGGGAPSVAPPTPYFGWDIAKDIELAATGFYVLDGYGGVHAGGGALAMSPATPYFGQNIARDLELAAKGYYVLDGNGGVHAGGGALAMVPATPYFGWDIAKDLALAANGYYVLDGNGGVHAGGGALTMAPATPYFGWNIARDLELAPAGYFVLDGYGGLHAGGGATPMSPSTPYFGWDIAKDMELAATGYYVLDGYGGVHAGGGAPLMTPATPYFGWNIARALALR